MVAACEQRHLNEHIVVGHGAHLVFQHSLLGSRHFAFMCVALVLAFVASEPVGQRTFWSYITALHHCPVCLVHIARAEHVVESRQSLRCLGKHHESAYGAVESVYNAKKHVAWLVVFLLDILLHCIGQRLVAGLVALHYLAAALVDYYNVIVFVDYLHKLVYELK